LYTKGVTLLRRVGAIAGERNSHVSIDATKECPFCLIARGVAQDTAVVGGADDWVAFFPLHPATRGHTLIIPREHVPDLWSADLQLAGSLAKAAVQVGQALQSALSPDGMNLITSSGQAAEQTIFHFHLHVLPRWETDAIGPIWPSQEEGDARADPELRQRIRLALERVMGQGA
jgi:histidine triad (HIT) family protein